MKHLVTLMVYDNKTPLLPFKFCIYQYNKSGFYDCRIIKGGGDLNKGFFFYYACFEPSVSVYVIGNHFAF